MVSGLVTAKAGSKTTKFIEAVSGFIHPVESDTVRTTV